MKVISVVGARPQFVKLAPIADAFAATEHDHKVIHTGQHYDGLMSEVFFESFGLSDPDWNLGVGSGRHGAQTAKMLMGIEDVLLDERPDWVLVYGDTNSTIAAALAAVKLHIPLAHLEAGLRSFNRSMPEEHNRILTDHASDLLLAPSASAAEQLRSEGLGPRTLVVGDVMVDIVKRVAERVAGRDLPANVPPNAPYVLATIHRAENTDDGDRLALIINALSALPLPVILPVHPRLWAAVESCGLDLASGSLTPIDPLGYEEMVRTTLSAHSVVTDSGGLQKEAFILGVPVTTLRSETEWTETLDGGWNVLAPEPDELEASVLRDPPSDDRASPYGDGNAAPEVVEALSRRSAGAD